MSITLLFIQSQRLPPTLLSPASLTHHQWISRDPRTSPPSMVKSKTVKNRPSPQHYPSTWRFCFPQFFTVVFLHEQWHVGAAVKTRTAAPSHSAGFYTSSPATSPSPSLTGPMRAPSPSPSPRPQAQKQPVAPPAKEQASGSAGPRQSLSASPVPAGLPRPRCHQCGQHHVTLVLRQSQLKTHRLRMSTHAPHVCSGPTPGPAVASWDPA